MQKKRRKSDFCLNCGTQYEIEVNYCPKCGQENNHNVASFGTVVVDFFHNYFSFDSKFSNSLLPFFFKPGLLTQQFIEGKRASFVNPIRLYLIISLVFFFVFSLVSQDFINKSLLKSDQLPKNIPDSTKVVLNENIDLALAELKKDSVARLYVPNLDSIKNSSLQLNLSEIDQEDDFMERNLKTYMKLRKDHNLEVQTIVDTLETDSLTDFQSSIVKKLIRIDRAEKEIVISHLFKNLPLMMLVLIPLFAAVLKLFYIRRGQYYITHLVHALHLHSFAYVIFGLAFLVSMYWLPEGNATISFILISWVLVCTHSYISFLKVYQQSWRKSLIKYQIIGFVYSSLLFIGFVIELLLSVVTY
ncbi:MAG: DUF3667 domain-containing protein [Reichenbachiella sp.]